MSMTWISFAKVTNFSSLKNMDNSTQGPKGQTGMDTDKQGFKSKRYRDKLRCEVKGLEVLLPVDRTTVHRKLDSQTVYRLSIAYFRTKLFLRAAGLAGEVTAEKDDQGAADAELSPNENANKEKIVRECQSNDRDVPPEAIAVPSLLQALDGFLLIVTSDGTILFVSRNILHHLGFNQVDLMLRCIYGIIHPDDQEELKMVLEQTLAGHLPKTGHDNQKPCCLHGDDKNSNATCRTISFLCRMKCFNGTTTGYLKMHCVGHMRAFSNVTKSQRTSNQVLFAFCRPFISVSTDPTADTRNNGFWTRHELDLHFKQVEDKITDALGHSPSDLEGQSFYELVHPEDLFVFRTCHKTLIHTEDIQTMYFRAQHKEGHWVWLHTRGKVVYKNSKKCAIVFTHCPVREEDSTYIQQEAVLRQRYAIQDLIRGDEDLSPQSSQLLSLADYARVMNASRGVPSPYGSLKDDSSTSSLHDPHGPCPSSWHTSPDRHSPVFPTNHTAQDPSWENLGYTSHTRGRVRKHHCEESTVYDSQMNTMIRYPGTSMVHYPNEYAPFLSQASQIEGHIQYAPPQNSYIQPKRHCAHPLTMAASGTRMNETAYGYIAGNYEATHPNLHPSYANGYVSQHGYYYDSSSHSSHAGVYQPGSHSQVAYDVPATNRSDTPSTWCNHDHSGVGNMSAYSQNYYSFNGPKGMATSYMHGHKKSDHQRSQPSKEPEIRHYIPAAPGNGLPPAQEDAVNDQNVCKHVSVVHPKPDDYFVANAHVTATVQYIAL